jgi:hypothetical protein
MQHPYLNEYNQGIKIGVIGPQEMLDLMKKTIKGFPSFDPIMISYEKEEEAVNIAKRLVDDVEVLLFTGVIPYKLVMREMKFMIPVHYVPLTGTCLYRALYRIAVKHGIESLSVDTIPNEAIDKTIAELGEANIPIVHYVEHLEPTRKQLFDFHRRVVEKGEAKAVLTALKSVSEELDRHQIINEWIVPTEHDMIVALERALLSTETRRSKESQIVIGLINIDDFGRLAAQKASEHDVQRFKLDIQRIILGYVESLNGYLTSMGGDEYMFMTTRGIFERETGGYKSIPLAHEIDKSLGASLSIGIGFGLSANDAGTHARAALRYSKDAGGNMCFIVREDRGVIGPLQMSQPLQYELSLIDKKLLKEAGAAGISTTYLSKLIAYVARTGKTEYNANELSSILGVTVRSIHRFLNTLLDAKLIDVIGEQKGGSRGRPKQIYRLIFLQELVRS